MQAITATEANRRYRVAQQQVRLVQADTARHLMNGRAVPSSLVRRQRDAEAALAAAKAAVLATPDAPAATPRRPLVTARPSREAVLAYAKRLQQQPDYYRGEIAGAYHAPKQNKCNFIEGTRGQLVPGEAPWPGSDPDYDEID